MTSRRARLLGATVALAALWPAGTAAAQESEEPPPPDPAITREDDPAWAGSQYGTPLDAGSHFSGESTVLVEGWFRYARDSDVRVTIVVEPLGPLAETCTHEGVTGQPTNRQPTDGFRGDYEFSDVLDVSCNGHYRVRTSAGVHWRPQDAPATTSPELTADLTVAAPAPDVTGFSITDVEDGVDLAWDAPESAPPDFLGYEIERTLPDEAPEVLTTLGPDSLSYRDTAPPAERTGTTYRVTALRSGPDGTTMRSTAPAEGTVPAPPPDDETPDETPAPTEEPSGDDPVLDGVEDEDPLRTSPTPVRDESPDTSEPTRPSLAPAPPGALATPVDPGSPITTTTTVPYDDGFVDRLPYRDRQEAAAAGVVPAEPARGVNRVAYDDGESGPGAALLTPVATALVLALWAAIFRHLAKLGKVASEPQPPALS